MTVREMQDEILRIKKEKDICILAHAYQRQDILDVADFVGDSFALSQMAAKAPQSTVLMCGVRFMAETVKILSPQRRFYFQTAMQAVLWLNRWIRTLSCSLRRCTLTIRSWLISIRPRSLKRYAMYA